MSWAMIVALFGIGAWVAVSALRPDDLTTTPVQKEQATTPSPFPESPSPTEQPAPTETPEPLDNPSPQPTEEEQPVLITEGVSVQVLNGAGDADADDTMADRLTRLGFAVTAINEASKLYPQTTVYWSYPQAQEAAVALAERFEWRAAPKPANLAASVALHVVVGRDET